MIIVQTYAQWLAENAVLSYQKVGVESDTSRIKYGDGATAWNSLRYSGLLLVGNSVIKDNSTKEGIIAFAGGGQASATILKEKYNIIGTVATTGDSVKCEKAIINLEKVISNISANDMDLFPATGESFQNGSTVMPANTAISIASGNSIKLVCYQNGIWVL